MQTDNKRAIAAVLRANRAEFHALLDSMSAADRRRESLNPGWTNQEVLFHMTFAFMLIPALLWIVRGFGLLPDRYSKAFANLLNAATPAFNVVNAAGARIGCRVVSTARLARLYDRSHRAILKRLSRLSDEDLKSGMYYPARWDALFADFMTIEQILDYPVTHFRFHAGQLAR